MLTGSDRGAVVARLAPALPSGARRRVPGHRHRAVGHLPHGLPRRRAIPPPSCSSAIRNRPSTASAPPSCRPTSAPAPSPGAHPTRCGRSTPTTAPTPGSSTPSSTSSAATTSATTAVRFQPVQAHERGPLARAGGGGRAPPDPPPPRRDHQGPDRPGTDRPRPGGRGRRAARPRRDRRPRPPTASATLRHGGAGALQPRRRRCTPTHLPAPASRPRAAPPTAWPTAPPPRSGAPCCEPSKDRQPPAPHAPRCSAGSSKETPPPWPPSTTSRQEPCTTCSATGRPR